MSEVISTKPNNRDYPRIVFMGTPEFAVASLDALVQAGYNIVGVVTAPDKPSGRGMKLNESAVKKYAVEKGLQVLQPEKLKNPLFLNELQNLHADLQIVVAFRMLPELVWTEVFAGIFKRILHTLHHRVEVILMALVIINFEINILVFIAGYFVFSA